MMPSPILRLACLVLALTTTALPAAAQSDWARVAVLVYNPAHLMQGLHAHWTSPRADDFAREAQALVAAMQQHCAAGPAPAPADLQQRHGAAREAWRRAALAWDRLAAVAVGPLVERRSQRQIDFTPTRPALIDKAIATAPQGAAAMERVGTPAKGLPALEWLLWVKPAAAMAPGTPACAYAVEVAADVEREAAALKAAFAAMAARGVEAWEAGDGEAAVTGMNELINQWVGGVERLRWAHMEKPLRSGNTGDLPRAASGTTAASWAAQWQALQALSVFSGGAAPAPGAGLVPLETYLRGRGLNPLADRLVRAAKRADIAVAAARPAKTGAARAGVLAAAKDLAAVKRLAEADLAPALNVSIGFSDADGD